MSVTAMITHISRTSLHDGPGVRTVVYFKGCGLRCRWCHNPETLSPLPEILYTPQKCIRCGRCVELCPEHHRVEGDEMVFHREGCSRCGRCAEVCPSEALTTAGRRYTVEELLAEVQKDRHYYLQSGGGVTLSGGECLLQADFCRELLAACRDDGIHTAVETALFVPWKNVERVLSHTDWVFADCKLADPEKHRRYTGQDNRRILANLARLAEAAPGRVTVRIPLIPGVNDTDEDIAGFARVLAPLADGLRGVEILRYNNLAAGKYAAVGMGYTDFGTPQTVESAAAYAAALEAALGGAVPVYTES